jgi:hypothetical protein
MRVKLKVGKVINGAVWPADSVVDLPEEEAKKYIQAQEAEPVNLPKPVLREEKEK